MVVALSLQSCAVVELRRYTLRPGRFTDLVSVFEEHLVEPQEEVGMTVAGTFADEDHPDTFTWLRGFADHDVRVRALADFYGGHVWARHASAANATMLDSDDVLLLRPTLPAHPPAPSVERGTAGGPVPPERALLGILEMTGPAEAADATEAWATARVPELEAVLGAGVAVWRSDPRPNGFPRLPVRADRTVVWLAVFAGAAARDEAADALGASVVGRDLARRGRHRLLRLTPTPRSAHPLAQPPRGAPS